MKRKIDYYATIYLIITILINILFWFELDNIINCYMTMNYCVFICDLSFQLYFLIILICVWCLWTFDNIIDIFCFKWD